MTTKFRHRIGRRGACLAMLSLLVSSVGWGTLTDPPLNYGDLPILNAADPAIWGVVQIILGLIGFVYVFADSPATDRYGFQAILLAPSIWGSAWLLSVVVGNYDGSIVIGLRQATLWLGYALLILIVSGMIGVEDLNREDKDR